MATSKRQVLIRVQPETYNKLRVIADKNHRSVSNQVEWLMLQYIKEYEARNGQIPADEINAKKPSILQQNQGGNNFLAVGGNNSVNQGR